jgi:hypothetical protein
MQKNTNLKAKFIKPTNINGTLSCEDCYWEVWSHEDLLLRVTVKHLCNQDKSLTYELIATYDFGKELINKTKRMKAFW